MKTLIRSEILLISLISSFLFFNSCGKKGPLKLDPILVPSKPGNFKVVQVGKNLRFSWKFPEFLKDGKTHLDISRIKKVFFYYSERSPYSDKTKRSISSDIFIKRGHLLKKTSIEQVHHNVDGYSFLFPGISGKLLNKKIFTAIYYKYNRTSSKISDIREIKIMLPIPPIRDLSITNEKKVIKLKWTISLQNKKHKKPVISGFNIFRKIKKNDEDNSSFKKINKEIVLKKYFNDSDTGYSGQYNYYVSVISTDMNISERSNMVSINIKDIFPPEVPANVLIFKSSEGLMLSWRESKDKDFSHYKIYRKKEGETDFILLNSKIKSNQFIDKTVKKGKNFSYYITSVDNNGNESEDSEVSSEQF